MPVLQDTLGGPGTLPAAAAGGLRRARRALLALGAGAATALAFPPIDLWPLLFVGPAVAYRLWEEDRPGAAFLHGWLYAVALLAVAGSWLFQTPHALAHIPSRWLELVLSGAFIAVMGVYMGVAGALYARLRRYLSPRARALLLLPALWLLAEWARGWLLTGFPWYALGYAAIDTPLAGWGPLFGSYGMSAAVAASAGAVAGMVGLGGAMRRPALLLAVLWGGGALLTAVPWTEPAGPALRVALVQPYHTLAKRDNVQRWQRMLDTAAERLPQSDLLLWPETTVSLYMVPLDGETGDAYLAAGKALPKTRWVGRSVLLDGAPTRVALAAHQEAMFIAPLEAAARAHGAAVVVGASLQDNQRRRKTNSLLVLGGATRAVYDKRHRVPFGEFVPLPELLAPVWDALRMRDSAYAHSRTRSNLLPLGGEQVGASVCYESAFGREIIEALPAASYLLMASNDGLFEGSAEPVQHHQVVRMRALESGRWVARANKVGVTATVAPDGAVAARLPLYADAVLQATVVPRTGLTPYGYWGDGMAVALALCAVAGAALRTDRRRRCRRAASAAIARRV